MQLVLYTRQMLIPLILFFIKSYFCFNAEFLIGIFKIFRISASVLKRFFFEFGSFPEFSRGETLRFFINFSAKAFKNKEEIGKLTISIGFPTYLSFSFKIFKNYSVSIYSFPLLMI